MKNKTLLISCLILLFAGSYSHAQKSSSIVNGWIPMCDSITNEIVYQEPAPAIGVKACCKRWDGELNEWVNDLTCDNVAPCEIETIYTEELCWHGYFYQYDNTTPSDGACGTPSANYGLNPNTTEWISFQNTCDNYDAFAGTLNSAANLNAYFDSMEATLDANTTTNWDWGLNVPDKCWRYFTTIAPEQCYGKWELDYKGNYIEVIPRIRYAKCELTKKTCESKDENGIVVEDVTYLDSEGNDVTNIRQFLIDCTGWDASAINNVYPDDQSIIDELTTDCAYRGVEEIKSTCNTTPLQFCAGADGSGISLTGYYTICEGKDPQFEIYETSSLELDPTEWVVYDGEYKNCDGSDVEIPTDDNLDCEIFWTNDRTYQLNGECLEIKTPVCIDSNGNKSILKDCCFDEFNNEIECPVFCESQATDCIEILWNCDVIRPIWCGTTINATLVGNNNNFIDLTDFGAIVNGSFIEGNGTTGAQDLANIIELDCGLPVGSVTITTEFTPNPNFQIKQTICGISDITQFEFEASGCQDQPTVSVGTGGEDCPEGSIAYVECMEDQNCTAIQTGNQVCGITRNEKERTYVTMWVYQNPCTGELSYVDCNTEETIEEFEKISCECDVDISTIQVCEFNTEGCLRSFDRYIVEISNCADEGREQTDYETGTTVILSPPAGEESSVEPCIDCDNALTQVCYLCEPKPAISTVKPVKVQAVKAQIRLVELKSISKTRVLTRNESKEFQALRFASAESNECVYGTSAEVFFTENGTSYTVNGESNTEFDSTGYSRIPCEVEICEPDQNVKVVNDVDVNLDPELIDTCVITCGEPWITDWGSGEITLDEGGITFTTSDGTINIPGGTVFNLGAADEYLNENHPSDTWQLISIPNSDDVGLAVCSDTQPFLTVGDDDPQLFEVPGDDEEIDCVCDEKPAIRATIYKFGDEAIKQLSEIEKFLYVREACIDGQAYLIEKYSTRSDTIAVPEKDDCCEASFTANCRLNKDDGSWVLGNYDKWTVAGYDDLADEINCPNTPRQLTYDVSVYIDGLEYTATSAPIAIPTTPNTIITAIIAALNSADPNSTFSTTGTDMIWEYDDTVDVGFLIEEKLGNCLPQNDNCNNYSFYDQVAGEATDCICGDDTTGYPYGAQGQCTTDYLTKEALD